MSKPRLQAYYLIRAAQQREELVAEADALRETIAAAERDEAALMAAAGQLLDGNERLDDSFRRASGSSSGRGLGSRSATLARRCRACGHNPNPGVCVWRPCQACEAANMRHQRCCGLKIGAGAQAPPPPPDMQCVHTSPDVTNPSNRRYDRIFWVMSLCNQSKVLTLSVARY